MEGFQLQAMFGIHPFLSPLPGDNDCPRSAAGCGPDLPGVTLWVVNGG